MKSERAKKVIYDLCDDFGGLIMSGDAEHAVEFAGDDMYKKAIESFCAVTCSDRKFCCIGDNGMGEIDKSACRMYRDFIDKMNQYSQL